MELNDPSGKDLYARVADIEKCIGDFAQVFAAFNNVLTELPQPDCPPYCMHNVAADNEAEFAKYKDTAELQDRVRDITRCIGDHAYVFTELRNALKRLPSPDCPPYCAHESKDQYSDKS